MRHVVGLRVELSAVDAEKWSPLLKWVATPADVPDPVVAPHGDYRLVKSISQRQRRLTPAP